MIFLFDHPAETICDSRAALPLNLLEYLVSVIHQEETLV